MKTSGVASGNGLRTVALFIAFLVVTGTVLAVENAPVTVTPRGSDAWKAFEELGKLGITVRVLGKRREAVICTRPADYPTDEKPYSNTASRHLKASDWIQIRETGWNLVVPGSLRFKPVNPGEMIKAVAKFNSFKVSWHKDGREAIFYRGDSEEAVGAVLKGLSSSDEKERIEAAWKGGWIEDPRVIAPLIKASADKSTEVSRQAARAVYRLGFETVMTMVGEGIIPALRRALEVSDPDIRSEAVSVLADIKNSASVPLLEKALKDGHPQVREATVRAVGKAGGAQAFGLLRNVFSDESADVRSAAAAALGRIGTPDALRLVEKAFKDKELAVRTGAVYGLGLAGRDSPLPLLEKTLSHSELGLRLETAATLGRIGTDRAVTLLEKAMKDTSRWVRYRALLALGRSRNKKACAVLEKALGNEDEKMREKSAAALGELGGEVCISLLEKGLKDEDEGVRAKAARALGNIKSDRAVSLLKKALNDEDEDVRAMAAEALGMIASEKCTNLLEKGLTDEEESVRSAAALALGRIGGPDMIALCVKALNDKESGVQYSGIRALGEIGSPEALGLLEKTLAHKDVNVSSRAVEALGRIGGDRAVSLLGNVLDRTSDPRYLQKDEKWVRKNALNALGRLNGEKPIGLIRNAVCSRKERAGLRYCEWPIRPMGHVNVNSRVSIAAIEAALGRIVEIFKKASREPPYTAFETAVMSLVRIGPGPRALPLLEKALAHDDESVRWRSTFALRMLGGSRAAILLEEALKNKKELNTFRWAVIDALVRIGGDKAREVLLANLSTPNKALNAHVAKQLKLNFWRDPRVAEALAKK